MAVQVVADPVPDECADRALWSTDHVVQLAGGGAVVDEQQETAIERSHRVRDLPIEDQAELGRLAIGSSRLRPPAVRRAPASRAGPRASTNRPSAPSATNRSARDPSRTPTRWTGSASRTSFASTTPVNEWSSPAGEMVREAGRGQPLAECLEAPRIDLHGRVPQHGEQLRPRPLEPAQDGLGEGPDAGSVLADDERRGRSRRSQTSISWLASAPKMGCASGAVRKSPLRPVAARLRGSSRHPGRTGRAP